MVNVVAKLLTLFLAIALTLEPCASSYASNLQSNASEASTTGIATPGSEFPNCHHVFRSHLAVVRSTEVDQNADGNYEPEANGVGFEQQYGCFADFAAEVSGKFRVPYESALYVSSRDRLNWLCRLLN